MLGILAATVWFVVHGGPAKLAITTQPTAVPSPTAPTLGAPVSPALVRMVTGISEDELAAVGAGHSASGAARVDPLAAIEWPALKPGGSKPQVLYIGGEFCPYCAAERWSLLNALARFGSFSGLRYMRSADNDGDIATITFARASYRSPYLDFVMREAIDRNRNDLQPLTDEQQLLDFTLGQGGVPFIDINCRYILNTNPAGYPSKDDVVALMGLDWAGIARTLQDPIDPITSGVLGNANYLTAAICHETKDRPASACQTATIQRLESALPTEPVATKAR